MIKDIKLHPTWARRDLTILSRDQHERSNWISGYFADCPHSHFGIEEKVAQIAKEKANVDHRAEKVTEVAKRLKKELYPRVG